MKDTTMFMNSYAQLLEPTADEVDADLRHAWALLDELEQAA